MSKRFISSVKTPVFRALLWLYRNAPLSIRHKRHIGNFALRLWPTLTTQTMLAKSRGLSRTLASHLRPSRHDGAAPTKILVIEHRIPTPDRMSGSVRMDAILELFAQDGCPITFVSHSEKRAYAGILEDVDREIGRYEQRLSQLGIDYLFGEQAAIHHLAEHGGDYFLIFISYPEIMNRYAPYCAYFAPQAMVVYDTVDLHHIRFLREYHTSGDSALRERAELYRKMETANIRAADRVIAITPTEAQIIQDLAPTASIMVVPNIHDVALEPGSLPDAADRHGLMFIGNYLHTPNEDAVFYFCESIFPLVQERLPDIELFLLGAAMPDKIRALQSESIQTIGYVEDPQPYFDRCRVFVAPLRYGAGMKGKIGQSLAFGLPVVTTPIGAEGMAIEHERHAMIADSPEAFAQSIVTLHTNADLWRALSGNGKEHIKTHFSRATMMPVIRQIMDDARQVSSHEH
jgi:glycosyltransferase involved in cell wall biosynthesis